jgi:DNA-binding transcriptional MerR regulator
MKDALDIAEVVRRTGLTSRALRFYEARGLVKPLRTMSGRRYYGPAELGRVQQIMALKRAGLSLSQIARLGQGGALDLGRLIEAQLDAIESRQSELEEARTLLLTVKSRIDRGEPVDAATFCSLIRQGDAVMAEENWKQVVDRHFAPEEQGHWAEHRPPEGFDQEGYSKRWQELGARIEAALPLDPKSAEALAFYDEWQALLAPFKAVATPQMMAGASKLYERMEEWESEQKPPFSQAVWRFMEEVGAARPRP